MKKILITIAILLAILLIAIIAFLYYNTPQKLDQKIVVSKIE